jgi:putative heme-binding domain-containing protein
MSRRFAFCCCLLWLGSQLTSPLPAAADLDEKTALAVETLSRLPATDLETNPKLKETVLRVLERTRGTASFVKLVQQFHLQGQNAGLLDVVIAQPASESGLEALRLVLADGGRTLVEQQLTGTNIAAAVRLAEALGNLSEKQANPLLLPLVKGTQPDATLRRQAVRSLAKTHEGAQELLRAAQEETLANDLRFSAANELDQVRWPELKADAAKLFPSASTQNSQALPPLNELLKRQGNIANGARLFTNAIPGCSTCHVVHGQGTDLGPNLSEIGTKLGKDALYEAILEPSSGISFGFEAFNITLKSGDETYGLIASETADEITVKAAGGIISRIKKSDIVSRQVSKLSLMPSGLQAAMSAQELVDLVEYLANQKR